mgnify:CR=1 FL=1
MGESIKIKPTFQSFMIGYFIKGVCFKYIFTKFIFPLQ